MSYELMPEAEFWDVFVAEHPRLPSVDELICQIIAIHCLEGVLTDRNGNQNFSRTLVPPEVVALRIYQTIRAALDDEEKVMTRHLRQHKLFMPYSWGLNSSNIVALTEAVNQVLDGLDVEDLRKLDKLFWEAYQRVEGSSQKDGRKLQWRPFSNTRSSSLSTVLVVVIPQAQVA
ncbi:hypothetical protein HD806DRAFT_539316 [Xylariaceae sp. AK1471]|nr:hypothetical protein HD806DRAFT_539316 [Xylariaceae sp. AK1471]